MILFVEENNKRSMEKKHFIELQGSRCSSLKGCRILLVLLFFLGSAPVVLAQHAPRYKNPTGKEFPIMGWHSIIGKENLTRERFEEMRDCGFNLSFSTLYSDEDIAQALDACRGTGVRQMIHSQAGRADTMALRFRNHEMTAGWFLVDEPNTSGFPSLRAFRDKILSVDTTHILYLNLLPSEVDPAVLLSKDYEDYVRRFAEEVDLGLISYDHYPVVEVNGEVSLKVNYFENLEIVHRVARSVGQPFWAFVLSTAHAFYPVPTAAHLRLQAFCDLAYGAQGIQYFTYWGPPTDTWDFHAAPIDLDGTRTPTYDLVREVNHQVQCFAPVFLGCDVTEVWHTGKRIPQGTQPLPQAADGSALLPAPFLRIDTDGEGLLLSHVTKGKHEYLMVVNRDVNNSQQVTVTLSKRIHRLVVKDKLKSMKAPIREIHNLAAGDCLLYKIR